MKHTDYANLESKLIKWFDAYIAKLRSLGYREEINEDMAIDHYNIGMSPELAAQMFLEDDKQ